MQRNRYCYTFMADKPDEITVCLDDPLYKDDQSPPTIKDFFEFAKNLWDDEASWDRLQIRTKDIQPYHWQLDLAKYRFVLYIFSKAVDRELPDARKYLEHAIAVENKVHKSYLRQLLEGELQSTFKDKHFFQIILSDLSVDTQMDYVVEAQILLKKINDRLTHEVSTLRLQASNPITIAALKEEKPISMAPSENSEPVSTINSPILSGRGNLTELRKQQTERFKVADSIYKQTEITRSLANEARLKLLHETTKLNDLIKHHQTAKQNRDRRDYLEKYASGRLGIWAPPRKKRPKLDPIAEKPTLCQCVVM